MSVRAAGEMRLGEKLGWVAGGGRSVRGEGGLLWIGGEGRGRVRWWWLFLVRRGLSWEVVKGGIFGWRIRRTGWDVLGLRAR